VSAPGQQLARRGVAEGAAAEGQHARAARREQAGDRLALARAEGRLALAGEELGHRAAGLGLDDPVDVGELEAPPAGQERPDRRLAGSHEADERDRPAAHRVAAAGRCQGMRAR
jgi:hypothetical protein